jgi:hypothetical protein
VVVASSETLRSVIDAGRSSKRLDELSSARVIAKIAMQAHAAQQKAGAGKAVGPITPTHISLSQTGEAKLEKSGSGSTIGYTSPEQINGGSGDRRSDVFSLGTVLWEALTHARLFDAMNDAAVRAAVQEREISAPADVNANVPAELSAICMRALSRNPADRYQSLKAFAVEIEEFLDEAGYADDDTKIAQFIVTLSLPASTAASPSPATTQPLPTMAPAKPAAAPAAAAAPAPAPAPAAASPAPAPAPAPPAMATPPAAAASPLPSMAKPATQPPPATSPAGTKPPPMGTPASTSPAPMSPTAFARSPSTSPPANAPAPAAPSILVDKPVETKPAQAEAKPVEAPSSVGKATILGMAPAPNPADWNDRIAAGLTPMPPVVPPNAIDTTIDAEHADPKQTQLGTFDAKAPAGEVNAEHATSKPNGESTAAAAHVAAAAAPAATKTKPLEATPAVAKAAPPMDDTRATVVDEKIPEVPSPPVVPAPSAGAPAAAPTVSAKPARAASQSDGTPRAPVSGKSSPNPVDAVSLPGRDSKGDLLAGWGWGTGKHEAIAPAGYAGDDDDFEQPNARKPLVYAIGGGLAIALLVTIFAFAAGGSKNKKKPDTAKATTADQAMAQAAQKETPPADTPTPVETQPALGSDTGSAAVDPAAAQAAAEQAAADKAAADKAAADKAAAEQAVADKAAAAKAEADKKELARQEKLARDEAAKHAKAEAAAKADADKKARQDAAKADADKKRLAREEAKKSGKTETPKTDAAKTEPRKADKTVAKADTTKMDPEGAYRTGLQQFARGDTSGALASLRTSLAGNPNYAPTWRGLGLVFEKMGQKDQAKNAYKRYLQLAPTAGDAEIIRGRLERLGS